MKLSKITDRLRVMYALVLIPLIMFGFYKNGIEKSKIHTIWYNMDEVKLWQI